VGRTSRTATILGSLATTIVIAGVLAPPAAAAPVTRSFAPAASASITPGAQLLTRLDPRTVSSCTADFVFTSQSTAAAPLPTTRGALYLGFSAHCASPDDEGTGCTSRTVALGTMVGIRGPRGERTQGWLAYNSWRTMQLRGERDPALCRYNDFALVAIGPGDAGKVNPSVPRLGGPTGLDVDGLVRNEPVSSYQPNNGGSGVKRGRSLGDDAGGRTHRVVITPPGVAGDSGSGFLDARGRAFGVLSTEFLDRRRSNGVTDLASALAYATRYGGLGPIALVPGTEPFRR
jgi:hypothetical protein